MNSTPRATLDGEVYYLERIGLPKTATYEVSLQDVSLADAPAVTLAKQSGQIKGQIPLPFHLTYDPAEIKPGHRYAISAYHLRYQRAERQGAENSAVAAGYRNVGYRSG